MDNFKREKGLASRTAAIGLLLDHAGEFHDLPLATFETVFSDSRPQIVAGASGSGKTTSAKGILERFDGPIFVLDTSSEWDFERIDYSRVSAIDWSLSKRYSCQVSRDTEVSKIEANLAFRSLSLAAHRGELRDWVVVIEEVHRFENDQELRSLLLEARKLCKKLLLLTAKSEPFEKLAPVLRPAPRSDLT